MKKAPHECGAEAFQKQNSQSAYSNCLDSLQVTRRNPARLDDVIRAEVREIWWRMRRCHGVPLPAEPGIISIAKAST